MPEVEIGGAILELPEGAGDDAIKRAVEDFRASPDFDRIIDKDTGAPARVRQIVGGAPEKDRLANLQRFYPDAVAYGEGNFVFTDPGSGRATLYNPEGLDFGDAASVVREGAQAIGATFGAVAGIPLGPPGVAAGAGLGSAAAGTVFDVSQNLIGGRIDTRGPVEAGIDTALDFGGAAIGQRGGELLEQGVKRALGGGKQIAQAMVQKFRDLGIEPPASAATGSRALGTLEKALDSSPASAQIMQDAAEKVLMQTKAAANNAAKAFGTPQTTQGAGETIRQAALRAAERFRFTQEKAYDAAFDLIGAEARVAVPSVAALRELMEGELSAAPASLAKALKPAISQLKAIEADATQGGIPFDALRQVRTMIGRDIDSPLLAGSSGSQNEAMKRIYGALTEDMSAAAKSAGPDAAKSLEVADRFTRLWMNTAGKTMQKVADFDADEQAFRFAISRMQDGGSQLSRLRRNFTPEEWDTVAASVLARMGQARPSAQDAAGDVFSVSTFTTNWNRVAPEAKEALFGGSRYAEIRPHLDKLVEAVSSLKGVERLTNTSNTARNLIAFTTISTLGGALGVVAGGDVESGAGGVVAAVAGRIVAPRVAAKLITSPAFVKWLTTPITQPNGLTAHLGRLVGIAKAEPEIREEIAQYLDALRATPAPTRTTRQRARATVGGFDGTPAEMEK